MNKDPLLPAAKGYFNTIWTMLYERNYGQILIPGYANEAEVQWNVFKKLKVLQYLFMSSGTTEYM